MGFAELDTVSGFGDALHDDMALRLAVWFHDTVYDTRRPDSEEPSAALGTAALGRGGASPALVSAAERLILATKTHRAAPDDTDCRILSDADLAVLGSSAADCNCYARAAGASWRAFWGGTASTTPPRCSSSANKRRAQTRAGRSSA